MAVLDQERGVYVVRIVYDGPPFSGKTTTLRALSTGLSRPIQCPGEHDGRTLFFDWLDYTGGRFEGLAIRCQVVSVPGQKSLAARRQKLLAGADAVVFVADSTRMGLDLSLKYAAEMRGAIDSRTAPAPGIVLQANKRDASDALPIPELLARFRAVGVEAAVIETEASAGNGVREAFLFGVRLALDRVRELISLGQLRTGTPEENSPEALLKLLSPEESAQPAPASSSASASPPATAPAPRAEEPAAKVESSAAIGALVKQAANEERTDTHLALHAEAAEAERIELPDPHVPSGYIWPPVEGRVIVQQAVAGGQVNITRQANGDLFALSPAGWRLHSRARDEFADSTAARAALVSWARAHALNQQFLSDRRCVMASAVGTAWRLWQIVGIRPSVEDTLSRGLTEPLTGRTVDLLMAAAEKLTAAAASFPAATVALIPTPSSIAADALPPRYIGLVPGHDVDASTRPDHSVAHSIATARFGGVVAQYASQFGADRLVSEIQNRASGFRGKNAEMSLLIELLQQKQTA